MEAERFLNYKEEFFMMLRFRKMMAVLLAAALTLTMLTACGGGGSSRESVNEKVKLTNDINEFLTGSYPKVEYDKELDDGAKRFYTNCDDDEDGLNKYLEAGYRWMTKAEIKEDTLNEAEVVADAVKAYLGKAGSKNYDWSIGYYINPKTDKDNKVIGKDIYVMLAKKEKAKK